MKLAFVGDLLCQKEQLEALSCRHGSWDGIFGGVKSCFGDSELVVGNLETPVAGPELGYTKTSTLFNTPQEFVGALQRLGVNLVSTANNHCLDRGVQGLVKTLEHLDALGLAHVGTYTSREDADRIFIRTIGRVRVAFVACTYGTNSESGTPLLGRDEGWRVDLMRPQKILHRDFKAKIRHAVGRIIPNNVKCCVACARTLLRGETCRAPDYIVDNVLHEEVDQSMASEEMRHVLGKIHLARQMADFVVVLPHCGGQYNPAPGAYQKCVVAALADAGADLIVSGHSHTPLGCEKFSNGAFAVYSLGNFCFTPGAGWYINNVYADYGLVMHVEVDDRSFKINSVAFDVTKSVVDQDGVSRVYLVSDLVDRCVDSAVRERLAIESKIVRERVGEWTF